MGCNNGQILQHHIVSGRNVKIFQGHTSWIKGLYLSEDDNYLVSSSHKYNGETILWNFRSGQIIASLKGHSRTVLMLKIIRNRIFSASSDKDIKIWTIAG